MANIKITLLPTAPAITQDDLLPIVDGTAIQTRQASFLQVLQYITSSYFNDLSAGNVLLTGDLAVNGGDLTTTSTTFNLLDTNADNVNFARAASTIVIGDVDGTLTIRNASTVLNGDLQVKGGDLTTDQSTFNLLNTTATTVNFAGAGTNINIGSGSGTLTIRNASTVLDGDLQVKGGDLTTNQPTFNLLNNTATTVNFAGAGTNINIGSGGGTTTLRNNIDITGSVRVEGNLYVGGENLTSVGTFNLLDTNVYTVNFARSASAITIGDEYGTLTIRNANTVLDGDLLIKGGDLTTNQSTFNLLNTTASTVNFAGAGTNINIGSTSGTTVIRSANVRLDGVYLTTDPTPTYSLFDYGVDTMNFAGESTQINIGADTGTTSIKHNLEVIGNTNLLADLTVSGRITAKEFHTQVVSSSIIYQSGSTKFGDTADDTHEITGSLLLTGSFDSIVDNFSIFAEENITMSAGSSLDMSVGGPIDISSSGSLDMSVGGSIDISSSGSLDMSVGGLLDITSNSMRIAASNTEIISDIIITGSLEILEDNYTFVTNDTENVETIQQISGLGIVIEESDGLGGLAILRNIGKVQFLFNHLSSSYDYEQEVLQFAPGNVVVNNEYQNNNFIVRGTTDPNTLVVKGLTNNVGIGLLNPEYKLDVTGSLRITEQQGNTLSFTSASLNISVSGSDYNISENLDFYHSPTDSHFEIKAVDNVPFVSGSSILINTDFNNNSLLISTEYDRASIHYHFSVSDDQSSITKEEERIGLNSLETVFNEYGQQYDFRVEGVGQENLIFADSADNKVGINTDEVSFQLDISGTLSTTSDIFFGGENLKLLKRDQYFSQAILALDFVGVSDDARPSAFVDKSGENFQLQQYTYGKPIITSSTNIGTPARFSSHKTAGFFDGTSSLILSGAGTNHLFNFGTAEPSGSTSFTIEAWIYPTAHDNYNFILTRRNSTYRSWGFTLYTDGRISFSDGAKYYYGSTISLNQWSHVAVSVQTLDDNSSNKYEARLFVDGQEVSYWKGQSIAHNVPGQAGYEVSVGGDYNNTTYSFNGYIKDLIVTRGVSKYNSDFEVPLTSFSEGYKIDRTFLKTSSSVDLKEVRYDLFESASISNISIGSEEINIGSLDTEIKIGDNFHISNGIISSSNGSFSIQNDVEITGELSVIGTSTSSLPIDNLGAPADIVSQVGSSGIFLKRDNTSGIIISEDVNRASIFYNHSDPTFSSAHEKVAFTNYETVFNEYGQAQDFRVEGTDEEKLLFVDSLLNEVNINGNVNINRNVNINDAGLASKVIFVNQSSDIYSENVSLKTIDFSSSVFYDNVSLLTDGLYGQKYDGYWNGSISFFDTATTYPVSGNYTSITGSWNQLDADTFSWQFFGYIKPTVTGTWTFRFNHDDGAAVWIGASARDGYNSDNALYWQISSTGNSTRSIYLEKDVFYPIRILWGDYVSSEYLNIYFTPPGGSEQTNGAGIFFGTNSLEEAITQVSLQENTIFVDSGSAPRNVAVSGNVTTGSISVIDYSDYLLGNFETQQGYFYFDGTGDYLSINNQNIMNVGYEDFTIETRIQFDSDSFSYKNTYSVIIDTRDANGNTEAIILGVSSDGTKLQAWFNSTWYYSDAVTLKNDGYTWHHIAFTRKSGIGYLYLDGQKVAEIPFNFRLAHNSITIGSLINTKDTTSNNKLKGKLKDFRVTKGIARYEALESKYSFLPAPASNNFETLSLRHLADVDANISEIQNKDLLVWNETSKKFETSKIVHTENLKIKSNNIYVDDEYYQNVVLSLSTDGQPYSQKLVDKSIYSASIYNDGGGYLSTTQTNFGYTSLLILGSNYITVSSNSQFDLRNTDFTIEAWIYPTNISGPRTFITKRSDTSAADWQFYLENGVLRFYNGTIYDFGQTVQTNQWSHVALVFREGRIRTYLNGTGSTTQYTAGPVAHTSAPVVVGKLSNNAEIFSGYIEDIRITRGVARYTQNFALPTVSYITTGQKIKISDLPGVEDNALPISNKILAYNTATETWEAGYPVHNTGSNQIIYQNGKDVHFNDVVFLLEASGTVGETQIFERSNEKNLINNIGGVVVTGSVTRFGRNTLYFNGVNSYLQIPWNSCFDKNKSSNSETDSQATDFTLEVSVYPLTSLAGECIFTQAYPVSGKRIKLALQTDSSGFLYFGNYDGSAWQRVSTTRRLKVNAWNDILIIRKASGQCYIYNNNELLAAGTISSWLDSETNVPYYIGRRWDTAGIRNFLHGHISDLRITYGIAREHLSKLPVEDTLINESTSQIGIQSLNDVKIDSLTTPDNSTLFWKKETGKWIADNKVGIYESSTFADDDDGISLLIDAEITGSSGFFGEKFVGYFNNQITPALTASSTGEVFISTNINNTSFGSGPYPDNFTVVWDGYFAAKSTGTYTFYLSSDDSSYLWIGNKAEQGYRIDNADLSRVGAGGEVSVKIDLVEGVYYPVKIIHGDSTSTDSLTFSFAGPEISKTTNGLGYFYDGRSLPQFKAVDRSSLNNTITTQGSRLAVNSLNSINLEKGSLYFDGSGDYLTADDQDIARFYRDDFTIEMWVNVSRLESQQSTLVDTRWSGFNGFLFWLDTSFRPQLNGIITSWKSLTRHRWHHVALTRKNGVYRIFIDGQLTAISGQTNDDWNSNKLGIGTVFDYRTETTTYKFQGYMNNIRITKYVARYTENFEVPMSSFLSNTKKERLSLEHLNNLSLDYVSLDTNNDSIIKWDERKRKWKNSSSLKIKEISSDNFATKDRYFDNVVLAVDTIGSSTDRTRYDIVDRSSYKHILTNDSNTQYPRISEDQFDVGDSSLQIGNSNTGDRLTTSELSGEFDLRNVDWTIEARIYVTNFNTWQYVVTKQGSGTDWIVRIVGTTGQVSYYNGSADYYSNSSIILNQWNHIVVERRQGYVRFYINGVLDSATYALNSGYNSANPVIIGTNSAATERLQGYIQDLRITKGVARYSNNTVNPPLQIEIPDFSYVRQGEKIDFSNLSLLSYGLTGSTIKDGESIVFDNQTNSWKNERPYIREDLKIYEENVTLLLNMSGAQGSTNFVDSSISNVFVTTAGNTLISASSGPFTGSSSAYFDGNGDTLFIPPGDHYDNFGTKDFTIEFFLKPLSNTDQYILDNDAHYGIVIIKLADNRLRLYISNNGSNWNLVDGAFSSSSLVSGQWNHIALTRNGDSFKLFINGVASISFTSSLSLVNRSIYRKRIGSAHNNTGWLTGYIADFRVTKNQARYVANFSVPTEQLTNTRKVVLQDLGNINFDVLPQEGQALIYDSAQEAWIAGDVATESGAATGLSMEVVDPNVSLLLNMNGGNNSVVFTDSSQYNLAITPIGNTKQVTTPSKFGLSAAAFDGSGDYLRLPNGAITFGTGAFTIETWIYLNAMPTATSNWPTDFTNHTMIITNGPPSSGNGLSLVLNSNNILLLNNDGVIVSGTHGITAGNWYHVAATREGNTFRLFVNGTQVGSATSSASLYAGGTYVYIGSEEGLYCFLNGYLEDLRVTKNQARYTSNFSVPTEQLKNTKLRDNYAILYVSGSELGSDSRFAWRDDTGTLNLSGSLVATTKSFDIVHPTKPNMRLRYGSLEGPENGVYVRGKTKQNMVELPDYWTGLVDEDTITVNLTPIGGKQDIWVEKIENNTLYIGGLLQECYFTVFGERKDVDKLVVEY